MKHPQTRCIFFQNYDLYGDIAGSETSPGSGLYSNMSKVKSVDEFLKKKRKARKKFKKLDALLDFYLEKVAGEVIDARDVFKFKRDLLDAEKEIEKSKDALNKYTPAPTTKEELPQGVLQISPYARDLKEIQKIRESVGEFGPHIHPFSQTRKDDNGFFFYKKDNINSKLFRVGDLVSDLSLNSTPYWKVKSIVADKIYLEPIPPNPFATGIGAGGAKITDFDVAVFTGDAESKRLNTIREKINSGNYDIDDVKYILLGTCPTRFGPNGAEGGWYNCDEVYSNRGGQKGMTSKQIMIADAKTLKDFGLPVPKLALSGEMDPYKWNTWIDHGVTTRDYFNPTNIDKYVDFHKKMTDKGRWKYDEESLNKMRQRKDRVKLEEFETEEDSEDIETIFKNVFNKERRISIFNAKKLIEICMEDESKIYLLHKIMDMGGSPDYLANEEIIRFFDLTDDIEGLKLCAIKLNEPDNKAYANAVLAKFDETEDFALKNAVNADMKTIYRTFAQLRDKKDKKPNYELINYIMSTNIIERIKELKNIEGWSPERYHAEDVLAVFRDLAGSYYELYYKHKDEPEFDKYRAFYEECSQLLHEMQERKK